MGFITNGELSKLVGPGGRELNPVRLAKIMHEINKFGVVKNGRRYYDQREIDAIRIELRRLGKLPAMGGN